MSNLHDTLAQAGDEVYDQTRLRLPPGRWASAPHLLPAARAADDGR